MCSRSSVWEYIGSLYAQTRPTVCARCIADDRLRAFVEGDFFGLHDIEINGAEPALRTELLQRTPGAACFNPYEWPVLNGRPLAFMGYGEDEDLIAVPNVRSAIEVALKELGWDFEPSPYALIFKEVDNDHYRVVIDLD